MKRREQERWVRFGNSLTSAPAGVDCTSLPGLVSRSGHSSSLKQPFETGLSCRFHSLYIDQAGLTHRDLPASASEVLELKACATTASLHLLIKCMTKG